MNAFFWILSETISILAVLRRYVHLFENRIAHFRIAGLTRNDVDLRARVIHVDHQLQRTTQMEYIIEDPKTESGTLPWDVVYMPHARFKATFGSKIQYMDAIYYFCTTFAGYEVP